MKIKEIKEGIGGSYKIVKTGPEGTTLQSPDMHTMLTLDPEAAKGIVADPTNPNKFTMNPAIASGSTDQAQANLGPKQGAEVEIPANEDAGGENYESEFTTELDDEEGNTIQVRIEYNIFGEEQPETWGYHGGQEAEHPEIDGVRVTNVETGEDITDQVDSDLIEELIWQDADNNSDDNFGEMYDDDVGTDMDPTDQFIDDVTDKEFTAATRGHGDVNHIKKLSGL